MISFFVAGTPKPQGSKRAFVNQYTGKASLSESAGEPLKDWRYNVGVVARDTMDGAVIINGPVACRVTFYLPRPKGHYLKSGLREDAPTHRDKKPDVDKLLRAVLDSLSGVVWKDDSQVISLLGEKRYADPHQAGAQIDVRIAGIASS